jgi:pimeloyl-ACP methyl ester carboxylesterase
VLIYIHDYYGKDSSWNYILMPPFRVKNYVENYNFVVIAKPGTPICKPHTEGQPPLIDTAFGNYPMFYKHDFLDYYVAQLNQVVNIIRKKSSKNAQFFFIGNSQGGHVVTKFADKYPKKVQKLVVEACGTLDRLVEQVFEYRLMADKGEISPQQAQEWINILYETYQRRYDYSTQNPFKYDSAKTSYPEEWHYRMMTDATYNFDIILPRLERINCPILFVYGTADTKVRENEMLPFFFTRWGKKNLTMMPVLGADHTFVKTIIDKETGEKKQDYIGDEVFADIEKWFSTTK